MNRFSLPEQYRKYYRALEPTLQKPKTKTYSTVIFFFLVVALFGWYAIKPTIQTILYLRREIIDKTTVNEQMDEKISALIEAQAMLEQLSIHTDVISHATPQSPNGVDLARQLEIIAKTAQASISAIQISSLPILVATPSNALPSYTVKHVKIPITILLDGGYPALSTFLRTILNMRRLISIDSITFTPKRSGIPEAGTNELKLQLKVTAYYQIL